MSFANLRVKTKLMLGFAAMALVVLLVSGLSLRSLSSSDERFSSHLTGAAKREHLATDMRSAANRRAIAARNLVLVTSPADREVEKALVTKAHEDMGTSLAALREVVGKAGAGTNDRDLFKRIEDVEAKYGPVALAIVNLALEGKREDAVAKMNAECRPLLAALMKATDDYVADAEADGATSVKVAAAAYSHDQMVLVVVCLLAALCAFALGWGISEMVTRPLVRAVKLAESVAAGDLRSDNITIDSRDETGQLLAALQRMTVSLATMVGSVRQSADGIATASSEIATGNQDLSARTEQQASALQQTASSMQQMTATVQHNADSSRQASQLASSAADVAGRGGQVVEQVVTTMGEISASSKRIADIISVIDGIAFQTNILALNAAVEAARAGEQGRGFAVVASEVRSLAQRSAGAAKEIKGLINASVERVEQGSALVDRAGATMTEVVASIRRVTDIMGEISAASTEQSAGVAQVGEAVAQMDQATQQNAALVEEGAAAAESLRDQAQQLVQTVAVFKLSAGAAAAGTTH